MQIWLSWNNNENRLLLPVNPESFELQCAGINTQVNVINLGALNLIGPTNLDTISFSSHFPAEYRPYCQYSGFPSPYECVELINKWRESGRPIRLIVTGTVINHAMVIDGFTFGQQGPTKDVNYTLELSEYRFINDIENGQVVSSSGLIVAAGNRGGKTIPYIYTCIAGDSFSEVARKTTGSSSNAAAIMAKNGITNPSAIFAGLELLIDGN